MINASLLLTGLQEQIFNEQNSRPKIIVNGKENVSSVALADELEGVMRSVRKLSPKETDNFTVKSNQQRSVIK